MRLDKFKGIGVALVTPFMPTGAVDFPALESIINDLITNGVDYIVAMATNSESPTLSGDEKRDVIKTITTTVAGRVPVMIGIGGTNTRKIIEKFKQYDLTGIDAILSVTPYYNKPSQEGLVEHYRALSYETPRPIFMYNVPGRTSCNLEADTTLRIADECSQISGIKEASGSMNQIMKIIKHKPEDFMVISGDDAITLPLLAVGIDGVISVVANAYPQEMSQLVHLGMQNRFNEAQLFHYKLFDIIQACFKEGSPAGVKAFMALQNKLDYYLRMPLCRVSFDLQEHIKRLYHEME
ncbi:MAG: 4-hydroxy-tetrahydrodipicolinate synthase [Bacteroidales bacterium]|jgi:4-hydroxy-tetrahydrodipicolinate synthase|nr:4-hydroxy-tetrahydrodipicolinate synthase [Bacteroidales bacterium]